MSSVVLYLFQPVIKFHEQFSLVLIWSIFAGLIWAVSFVSFVTSIDYIGLSRSNQWKNLQGPVGVILSLIILGEYISINPFFAILAALTIFISAVFFTNTSAASKKNISIKGIYYACFSALGFGTVAVIQKYVTNNAGVYIQQIVWSLSIATFLFLYILTNKKLKELIKSSKKEISLSLTAGVFYLGASIFQLFSYQYVPASIGFTIIQLNALWTIIIGIWIFKEIDLKKYYKKVFLGFIFTILGIMFLLLTKK